MPFRDARESCFFDPRRTAFLSAEDAEGRGELLFLSAEGAENCFFVHEGALRITKGIFSVLAVLFKYYGVGRCLFRVPAGRCVPV